MFLQWLASRGRRLLSWSLLMYSFSMHAASRRAFQQARLADDVNTYGRQVMDVLRPWIRSAEVRVDCRYENGNTTTTSYSLRGHERSYKIQQNRVMYHKVSEYIARYRCFNFQRETLHGIQKDHMADNIKPILAHQGTRINLNGLTFRRNNGHLEF